MRLKYDNNIAKNEMVQFFDTHGTSIIVSVLVMLLCGLILQVKIFRIIIIMMTNKC